MLYSILYILVYLFITSVKNPILFKILPLNQPATFNKCALYININVCRTIHPKTKVSSCGYHAFPEKLFLLRTIITGI